MATQPQPDWMNFDIDSLVSGATNTGQPRDLGNLDGVSSPSGFEGIKLPSSLGEGGGFLNKLKDLLITKTDSKTGLTTKGLETGIGIFGGLASAYLGWQQFNLAKDQLAQNKKIFNLNFANQAQMVNTQLEDRQRARVASSSTGAYESVSSYMDKHAIKQKGI